MREAENIRQADKLGIDWMGFIFYGKSLRAISASQLATLDLQLSAKKVGVFVNATLWDMMETATNCRLDYLQLHGHESPDTCYALHKRGYALIKAFPISTANDLKPTEAYEGSVDYFLFDTQCNGYGGSGQQFDWSLLSNYHGETPFLLSGGIHPQSMKAIRDFSHPRFAGIDLNSGFETAPGMKDIHSLTTFINKIKQ